ncbi:MAG TPA: hypothetical protein VL443_18015 [Cyclobacteriaceae bacterium]|jgi:hypothetical protein|nr:hypothetical protein [Cyclobacteriaceae bacterium]
MISLHYLLSLTLWIAINPKEPRKDDFKGTYVSYSEALPYQFEKRLTINCDSTVKTSFKGGRIYETLTGRWTFHSDTLKVKLNPKIDKQGLPTFPHWKEEQSYLLHKNLLIPIISPADKASKHRRKYTFAKVKVQKCIN